LMDDKGFREGNFTTKYLETFDFSGLEGWGYWRNNEMREPPKGGFCIF
jgi:hypothetical protein